jgi:uncharacterized protein YegP (UPF0339 family)
MVNVDEKKLKMASGKDRYRLDQKSPNRTPGFESFKQADDGMYYFHFNDDTSTPLLFSQGYKTAKDRDRGLNAVKRNLDHYELKSEKEKHFWIIRSGNAQEIARSRDFGDVGERDVALMQVSQLVFEKSLPTHPSEVAAEKSFVEDEGGRLKRHLFTLEWQERGKQEDLLGIIQYTRTQKKASFQGLDVQTILSFLQNHVPELRPEAISPHAGPAQKGNDITEFKRRWEEAKEVDETKTRGVKPYEMTEKRHAWVESALKVVENGVATDHQAIKLQPWVAFSLQLKGVALGAHYKLALYSRSFDNGRNTELSELQGQLAADGAISWRIAGAHLPEGSHLLNARVEIEGAGESLQRSFSSRAVHFYR